jgi:hypothetical protein
MDALVESAGDPLRQEDGLGLAILVSAPSCRQPKE